MILYPTREYQPPTNEWRPQYPDRPLLFLDVDGVINWTAAPLDDTGKLYEIVPVSGGWLIIVPYWMKRMVRYLVDSAEVVWLTAWKEEANKSLPQIFDIPKLPTLTDNTRERHVQWKVEAMQPVAHQAHDNGREVIWIEDFGFNVNKSVERLWARRTYKGIPKFVHTIDTLPFGAMHWTDLRGTPLERQT